MSMSLSCSSVWITLSGLKSQYTSPRSCRYPSAGSTSIAYAIACATGTEPPEARASTRICLSDLPPTYSITMYPADSPVRRSACCTKL